MVASIDQAVIGQTVLPREAYEGAGGWKDGRWGQAYDLVHAALKDAGYDARYDHPILHMLEMEGAA